MSLWPPTRYGWRPTSLPILWILVTCIMCSSRNYLYHPPPTEGFSVLHPPHQRDSSLASYFASKILAFKTPFPLGISNDLPWGGYGFFFWNYTIAVNTTRQVLLLVNKCLRTHLLSITQERLTNFQHHCTPVVIIMDDYWQYLIISYKLLW